MPSKDFLALNPGYASAVAGRSKHNNRKVVIDGYTFDSQAEANRYLELQLLVKAGTISNLEAHPLYELHAAGKHHRAASYEGDFSYTEAGRLVVEDVKGYRTAMFKLKEKLFRARYPHIELRIIQL